MPERIYETENTFYQNIPIDSRMTRKVSREQQELRTFRPMAVAPDDSIVGPITSRTSLKSHRSQPVENKRDFRHQRPPHQVTIVHYDTIPENITAQGNLYEIEEVDETNGSSEACGGNDNDRSASDNVEEEHNIPIIPQTRFDDIK